MIEKSKELENPPNVKWYEENMPALLSVMRKQEELIDFANPLQGECVHDCLYCRHMKTGSINIPVEYKQTPPPDIEALVLEIYEQGLNIGLSSADAKVNSSEYEELLEKYDKRYKEIVETIKTHLK